MVRIIGLAIGLLLCGATYGVTLASDAPGAQQTFLPFASDATGAQQTILPFEHTDGVVTTVFTVTNTGDVTAAYQPCFYVHTGNSDDFPFRLIYQNGSRLLEPGASDSFSSALYGSLWTEPANTLVVRSDMPVSVTLALLDAPVAATHNVWLPIYTK